MAHGNSTISASTAGDGWDMAVWPTEAKGQRATFAVTFRNQANDPVAVGLEARDSEDGLRFHIEPQSWVIVPAAATAAPLTVHVVPNTRAASGRPHPYEIELRGVPIEDKATNATVPGYLVKRVRFTYVPRYELPWPLPRSRRLINGAVVVTAALLAAVMAAVHATGWLSVIAVAVLLILLVEKQSVVGASDGRAKELSKILTIAILPLLLAFAFNVLTELGAAVSQGPTGSGRAPETPQRCCKTHTMNPGARRRHGHGRQSPAATPATTGVRPKLATVVLLNPHVVRFGKRDVAKTVYVLNLGPASLTVRSVTLGGSALDDFVESGTCAGKTISVYRGCTISVRFRPLRRGFRDARLAITDNAARSPQIVLLSGRA